jgi:Flp pilus assembly secretin CpaC
MRFSRWTLISLAIIGTIICGNPADSLAQTNATTKKALQDQIAVAQLACEEGMLESSQGVLDKIRKDFGQDLTDQDKAAIQSIEDCIARGGELRADARTRLAQAQQLHDNGEYAKAYEVSAELAENKILPLDERQAAAKIKASSKEGYMSYQQDMKDLFNKSIEDYKAGNYDTALESFQTVDNSGVEVSHWFKDAGDYAEMTRAKMAEAQAKADTDKAAADKAAADKQQKAAQPAAAPAVKEDKPAPAAVTQKTAASEPAEIQTAQNVEAPEEAAPSSAAGSSYIDQIERTRNIKRQYTQVVVNDAIAKANEFMAQGDYTAAREALTVAYSNINKTKMVLGEELYGQYDTQLNAMRNEIADKAEAAAVKDAELRRKEQNILQSEMREKMERERKAAVEEYKANALEFHKKQRYEEALAQINALLGIDPLNDFGLAMQASLQDTILWREQSMVQKTKYEQEIKTLIESDRASIPWSDDVHYPSNWTEISKKRDALMNEWESPEDAAINKQLESVVDLMGITQDTSFEDAIEMIKTAVEPNLNIVVLWRDLEDNAFIDRDTPVNLTFSSPVSVSMALELLLESVSGGFAELDYVVKNGIVQIATIESLPDRLQVVRYDVADLLGERALFQFEMDTSDLGQQGGGRSSGGGGGSSSSRRSSSSSQDDEDIDRTEMLERSALRVQELMDLIQQSIDPESWYDAGGQATISTFNDKTLVISQTIKNHSEVRRLLNDLRASLGQQVALETRFLIVSQNYLEEIGIDVDFLVNAGGKWGDIIVNQNHASTTGGGQGTGVPGNLADSSAAASISGGYGSILDDLQVQFLINATQSHRDTKSLNAPRVAVLSGESAAIRVTTDKSYVADYEFEDVTTANSDFHRVIADPEISTIQDGVILNVTPTISMDKKYVLLRITTSFTTTSFSQFEVPSGGESNDYFPIQLPESEIAEVRTRVSVPDSGTLLIGGQKLTGEVDLQSGVPVLSKVPGLGRLFENKAKTKDTYVLLILVKPTILLQDELEAEAVAGMQSVYY